MGCLFCKNYAEVEDYMSPSYPDIAFLNDYQKNSYNKTIHGQKNSIFIEITGFQEISDKIEKLIKLPQYDLWMLEEKYLKQKQQSLNRLMNQLQQRLNQGNDDDFKKSRSYRSNSVLKFTQQDVSFKKYSTSQRWREQFDKSVQNESSNNKSTSSTWKSEQRQIKEDDHPQISQFVDFKDDDSHKNFQNAPKYQQNNFQVQQNNHQSQENYFQFIKDQQVPSNQQNLLRDASNYTDIESNQNIDEIKIQPDQSIIEPKKKKSGLFLENVGETLTKTDNNLPSDEQTINNLSIDQMNNFNYGSIQRQHFNDKTKNSQSTSQIFSFQIVKLDILGKINKQYQKEYKGMIIKLILKSPKVQNIEYESSINLLEQNQTCITLSQDFEQQKGCFEINLILVLNQNKKVQLGMIEFQCIDLKDQEVQEKTVNYKTQNNSGLLAQLVFRYQYIYNTQKLFYKLYKQVELKYEIISKILKVISEKDQKKMCNVSDLLKDHQNDSYSQSELVHYSQESYVETLPNPSQTYFNNPFLIK